MSVVTQETRVSVKSGISFRDNALDAAKDLFSQISQDNASIYILFASSKYDIKALESALRETFPETTIGCTTSGEIGPHGYAEGSLVGASLASPELHVNTAIIHPLQKADAESIARSCENLRARLSDSQRVDAGMKHFGLLFIDGLSVREEQVVAHVFQGLGQIPLVGGSSGDDMAFLKSHVYCDGRFLSDAASISVFSTTLPFKTFKTQHFLPTAEKLVITSADPERRIVKEINGTLAALEYARILKVNPDELGPMIFSANPLMLRIGGEYYVRSVQRVNDDMSLTFFCAIDEGLVLTLSRGVDMIADLREALRRESTQIRQPLITISCECILRRLEVLDKHLTSEMNSLIEAKHLIGFHTYGEQYNPIHINQTFAGVIIGQ